MIIYFSATFLFAFGVMNSPQGLKEQDESTICRIIADGYQKYYESFPIVSCRYRVIKGDAESIDQALQGQYRRRISAPSHWYVSGTQVRVGVNPDLKEFSELWKKPEYTKKNPLNQTVQRTPMETLNVLDNGSLQISEEPAFGIATIYDASSRRSAVWFTPLDMGIMGWGAHSNPAKDITSNIQEKKLANF